MLKRLSLISFTLMTLILPTHSHAGWLLYSKPEFRGRVIDAETKVPIKEAVVVAVYNSYTIIGGPGGRSTDTVGVKEALTDNNGEFYLSAYTSLFNPFYKEDDVSFIIFKPGYKAITRIEVTKIPDEKYFSIKKDMIGKDGEIKHVDHFGLVTWRGLIGIVEMHKVSRDRAMPPGMPTDYGVKELPLLYKAINEDRKNRGLEVR